MAKGIILADDPEPEPQFPYVIRFRVSIGGDDWWISRIEDIDSDRDIKKAHIFASKEEANAYANRACIPHFPHYQWFVEPAS